MVVGTRKRIFFGVLVIFLFTACSVGTLFSRDQQVNDTSPTNIVSPTPNLTVTAVFAGGDAETTDEPSPVETDDAAEEAPTATPDMEPEPTEAPTALPTSIPYEETPASAVISAVEAISIAASPVIDGDLTDWPGEMYAITDIVYGSEYYANPADLSAQFKIAWDSNYLYLGVVVFDTRFTQTAVGSQMYLGDSLEILLDTDLLGDADVTELNSDDFQVGISPGNLNDVAIPEAYLWYPSGRMGSLTDVQIAGVLIDSGYVVEVALPWVDFGVTPFDGLKLGFLLSVSDNDMEAMNAQQSVVSFSPLRELQNPTSWSELELVGP